MTQDEHLSRWKVTPVLLELQVVPAALAIGLARIHRWHGEGLLDGSSLEVGGVEVDVVGDHSLDRVSDQVDQPRLGDGYPNPLRDVEIERVGRVCGRRFAA